VAGLTETAHAVQEIFPRAPARLAFETSFFVDLPARERTYAMSPELAQKLALRRWGYPWPVSRGGFAGSRPWLAQARVRPARPAFSPSALRRSPKIAAVLRPSAIYGHQWRHAARGLPGETNSGRDRSRRCAGPRWRSRSWPRRCQCRFSWAESGLSGLVGHRVRLDHVLASKRSDCVRARDVLLYRMLLASGTAAAALGGVEQSCFPVATASCSAVVAQHVFATLWIRAGALGPHASEWTIFAKPLEAVLADTTIAN